MPSPSRPQFPKHALCKTHSLQADRNRPTSSLRHLPVPSIGTPISLVPGRRSETAGNECQAITTVIADPLTAH